MQLADDFWRLAHHDVTGKPRLNERAAGLGLAAALLGELLWIGKINIRDGRLWVADNTPRTMSSNTPCWSRSSLRRCYRSPCGCRLSSVDAEAVERQTYNALDDSGLLPIESVFDPTEAAGLFMLALVAVRVGAVPEELAFIWRI